MLNKNCLLKGLYKNYIKVKNIHTFLISPAEGLTCGQACVLFMASLLSIRFEDYH